MSERYVATGACAGCPYRSHCHDARQHAMDAGGLGRHTLCPYFREFERRALPRPAPRPGLIERIMLRASDALRARRERQ